MELPIYRCPKCGAREFRSDRLPSFALAYEATHDTDGGERLRVACNRCGYVGFEDTADVRAKAANVPPPPPNDRVNSLTRAGAAPVFVTPRSLYVLLGMGLALGAAFLGRVAAVVL